MNLPWRRRTVERSLLERIAVALETRAEPRADGGAPDVAQLVKAHNLLVAHVDGLAAQLAKLKDEHARLRGKVYKDPEFHTPRASGATPNEALPLPLPLGTSGLPDLVTGGEEA